MLVSKNWHCWHCIRTLLVNLANNTVCKSFSQWGASANAEKISKTMLSKKPGNMAKMHAVNIIMPTLFCMDRKKYIKKKFCSRSKLKIWNLPWPFYSCLVLSVVINWSSITFRKHFDLIFFRKKYTKHQLHELLSFGRHIGQLCNNCIFLVIQSFKLK